jgi:uncharacterized protein YwqG
MLVDEIAALTGGIASTDHSGRHNRLYARRQRLLDALARHESWTSGFSMLLGHADANVRLTAAWYCRWHNILAEPVSTALRRLAGLPGDIGESARSCLAKTEFVPIDTSHAVSEPIAYQPPPAGRSRAQAAGFICDAFPGERGQAIVDLLRSCIRIWPTPAPSDPAASRFGGMPIVPPGWSWPFENEEPLLFLAQIDCTEVRKVAGPSTLPDSGILAFFGDHDDVNGCGPVGGGAVYHFPDKAQLKPAAPPLDDFEPLIGCGLAFYNHVELPSPDSLAARALAFSKDEREVYCEVFERLTTFGCPEDWDIFHVSKLFGWPDLVQDDLDAMRDASGRQDALPTLLLQIGWYHDGLEWQSWGPGGIVYFTLDEQDLAAGRFDAAELEMQGT